MTCKENEKTVTHTLDYLLREFIGLVFNNERDEKTRPF
jgi:hypothetical protein